MREYDEMTLKIAGRIFEKGDEILEKRRKRTVFIKKLSLSVSGVCAAVIAGAAVWHNNDLRNSVHHEDIPVVTEVPQTEASEKSAETAAAQTTASLTSSTSSKQTSAVSSVVAADITAVESAAATVTSSAAYEDAAYPVTTSAASVDTVTTTAVTTASNTEVSPVTTAVNTAVTVPTEEIAAETTTPAVLTRPSSYVEHTNIPEQAYPVTTVKTTAAESEVHVTETKADYIKNGRFIRRLDYTEKADDSRVLLDENGVQHRVKVQYADSMSADEIIAIMGDTSFCDTNVFSFSGMYEGITGDTFFFVIEHYSYVPETETIYSTKMKVYCVQLDDGSKAYAVKLPQSDGYYLYTVSEKTDEEIYWRER